MLSEFILERVEKKKFHSLIEKETVGEKWVISKKEGPTEKTGDFFLPVTDEEGHRGRSYKVSPRVWSL